MDINKPNLPFFADLIRTETQNLDYAIIRRKSNGLTVRHPGLTVMFLTKYAFDLLEGRFVQLGSFPNKMTVAVDKKVAIVQNNDGSIVFWDRYGHRVDYSLDDFRNVYWFRFINPMLYK